MSFFDLILLISLGGFFLFGLWFGFLHALGALVGTVLGALLASRWYESVALVIFERVGGSLNIIKIVAFMVVFVVINRLVGFLFWILEKTTGIFTRLPFLKSVNRLVGGIFGFIEGVFVLGLSLSLALQLPILSNLIKASKVAKELMDFARVLIPLLPEAWRAAQQIPQIQLPDVGAVQQNLQNLQRIGEDVKPLQELIR